jgi:tight adherence protein B
VIVQVRPVRVLLAIALLLAVVAVPLSAHAAEPLVVQKIETSSYPKVTLNILVPSAIVGGTSVEFTAKENGKAVKVTQDSGPGWDNPTSVVLLIDTSGSMKGRPLRDAVAAAKRFISAMGPNDEVAVVTFGTRSAVAAAFTSDQAKLKKALSGLSASGETAMYDAVVQAAKMFEGQSDRQKDIVLLSDGGDTASSESLTGALAVVKGASAPLFAVALKSPEANPTALATLAKRTGGRLVSAKDSSELAALYEGIAKEIRNLYRVSFVSLKPLTSELELDLSAAAGAWTGKASTVIPNPQFANLGEATAWTQPKQITSTGDKLLLFTALVLLFVAGALVTYFIALMIMRERNTLSQLSYYEQIRDGGVPDGDVTSQSEPAISAKMKDAVGYVAGKRGITETLYEQLERAGLPLRPVEYMYVHILTVVGLGVLTQLITRDLLISVTVVVVAVIVPLAALSYRIRKRTEQFEAQLPDLLNHIAGSLRSGWGLLQAIELLSQEVGQPASGELKRVVTEARLGLPVETALEKMAKRLGSENFAWAVAAINIQRDVGGNLAEVLDIVATTMRDRAELKRHIDSLTAEGRLSAWILIALPFIVLVVTRAIVPDYETLLFTTTSGIILAGSGVVLLLIGIVWLLRVSKVEV